MTTVTSKPSQPITNEQIDEYLRLADEILDHDFGPIDPLNSDTMSEIIRSFLWLGNRKDANRINRLLNVGITHVLNCAKQCPQNEYYAEHGIATLKVNASDDDGYDIIDLHLEECLQFILQAKPDGKVLVHCMAGVNRSATIVTAYLMHPRGQNMHFLEAIEYIARRREAVLLNKSFKIRLIKYAHSMNKLVPYHFQKTEKHGGCCSIL